LTLYDTSIQKKKFLYENFVTEGEDDNGEYRNFAVLMLRNLKKSRSRTKVRIPEKYPKGFFWVNYLLFKYFLTVNFQTKFFLFFRGSLQFHCPQSSFIMNVSCLTTSLSMQKSETIRFKIEFLVTFSIKSIISSICQIDNPHLFLLYTPSCSQNKTKYFQFRLVLLRATKSTQQQK